MKFCCFCGQELPDPAEFCFSCGSKLPELKGNINKDIYITENPPDYAGKICPYCRTELTASDEVITCNVCGMPHHKSCWEENSGCTTFGCSEQHCHEQHTNPVYVCDKCGTPLEDTQRFCTGCGAERNIAGVFTTGAKFCGRCGAKVDPSDKFCIKCGTPII